MTHEQMITYLKNVVDLEKAKQEQERTIGGLEYQISRLGFYAGYKAPAVPSDYQEAFEFEDYWGGCVTFILIGGFIGLFSGDILIGAFIGFICASVLYFGEKIYSEKKTNRERQAQYQGLLSQYRQNIAADERRVAQELAEKEHLQELLASLRQRYSETTATLQQYYDLDIIFPKYRNMTAMCSIYEYYLSGRCDSLMGHEGAYNILEGEIRFGVIFTKLDDIMSKLDEIKTNQSILYDAIESGNKLTNKLIDASIQQARQLEFVAEKTELAAYNAQRAANEANQIKWIKILELSERNN